MAKAQAKMFERYLNHGFNRFSAASVASPWWHNEFCTEGSSSCGEEVEKTAGDRKVEEMRASEPFASITLDISDPSIL